MQIVIQDTGVSMHNATHIVKAANELGIPFHGVSVVPFTFDLVNADDIDLSLPTFWYGSTGLLQKAHRDYQHTKGVFFTPDMDMYKQYYPNDNRGALRNDYLNSESALAVTASRFISESHLARLKGLVGDVNPMFVRPSSSLKGFAGTVLTKKNWDEKLVDIKNFCIQFPDELITYNEYVDIWAEWRFFIVDGEVVTGSLYKEQGRLETRLASPDMIMIAQALSTQWKPLDTCVMDVGLTKDGLKVIEFNSVNSSGLYDSDAKKLLSALQELMG